MIKKLRKFALVGAIIVLYGLLGVDAVAQQISVPRIDSMPDMPSPYLMRDWKEVARDYDTLAFDWNATGTYLPLVFNSGGLNYPSLGAFGLQSYVGMDDQTQGEGINVIPALVGASLVGIDKSAQDRNYVEQAQQWFNSANGLDMYLNNFSSGTGSDWWYETMPNVFFFQLAALYPSEGDFDEQIIAVADQLLTEVDALGGSTTPWSSPNFNYTSFSFTTMAGTDRGWKQPEAAGAISWLLFNAYRYTGDERYRIGAEQAMDFLTAWNTNPSYEIQMPYGVYAAARMNAELATDYDIEKMVNWVFEESDVRNWGVVVGTWGGYDVSGLVGEVDSDGYAFMMNGYQTASALVPMVRYDDRFAHAIGKWMLNLANASRLFYTPFLPDTLQDGEAWTHAYDPDGAMGHEAIRQDWQAEGRMNGIYASGDATYGGWANTNFALYGSSHVGYLGALVDTTDIEGILQIDARVTDFYQLAGYPTWLLYNPHGTSQNVTVQLTGGSVNLWDMVANQYVATGVGGSTTVSIPADEAMLLVEVPTEASVTSNNGVMMANMMVVDYSDGSPVGNLPPRMRSLSAVEETLVLSGNTTIYATVNDPEDGVVGYTWSALHGTLDGTGASVTYTAPESGTGDTVRCVVNDGEFSDSLEIELTLTPSQPPTVQGFVLSPPNPLPGEEVLVFCDASDPDGDDLTYDWSVNGGSLSGSGDTITWTAPASAGYFTVICTVEDPFGLTASDSVEVIVGDLVLYLPFNGNGNDESPFGNDATITGGSYTTDRLGTANAALRIAASNTTVQVPNSTSLNGQSELTLAFWMDPDQLPSMDEYYLVSHGSYENRWKITMMTNGRLRWTVNSSVGITDLDNSVSVGTGLTHVAATFGNGEIAIYVNGAKDGSKAFGGLLSQTDINLTIGQKVPGVTTWNFPGIIDEVRLYNRLLTDQEIGALVDVSSVGERTEGTLPKQFGIASAYPNPFNARVNVVVSMPEADLVTLDMFNLLGQRVMQLPDQRMNAGYKVVTINADDLASGVYLIRVMSSQGQSAVRRIVLVR